MGSFILLQTHYNYSTHVVRQTVDGGSLICVVGIALMWCGRRWLSHMRGWAAGLPVSSFVDAVHRSMHVISFIAL